MDYRYDLQYLCDSEDVAKYAELLQCWDGFHEMAFCGVDVNDEGGNYMDLSIDYLGIIEYPKHIDSRTKCYNPFECINICARLRSEGRAPPTCTFCNTKCPFNFFESLNEIVVGIVHDVGETFHIVTQCVERGLVNCICAGALMLRPKWLDPTDFRYSPKQKCYVDNPLKLIIQEIGHMLTSSIGGAFGSFFTSVFDGFNPMPGGVQAAQAENAARAWCETSDRFGHKDADQCYYKRVSAGP